MQRNCAVAAPLMTTLPGFTGWISNRPAVQWIPELNIVPSGNIHDRRASYSFTYYMEFGLQSLVSAHPYRSVGAVLLWQRTGAFVGPPAPIRWQFVAPGPVAALQQLRPRKINGQGKR